MGHSILKFHCIVHQENLCAKLSKSELNELMKVVVKIVNYLVARTPLTHRQFRAHFR